MFANHRSNSIFAVKGSKRVFWVVACFAIYAWGWRGFRGSSESFLSSQGPSRAAIVGTWTYVTDTGGGIGRLNFREDGSYSESFSITTRFGTTASRRSGVWTLEGNKINMTFSGFGATGSSRGGGVSGTLSGTDLGVYSNGVISIRGAAYTKD